MTNKIQVCKRIEDKRCETVVRPLGFIQNNYYLIKKAHILCAAHSHAAPNECSLIRDVKCN